METTTQQVQTWTILSLIEWGTQYLLDRQFDDARLNVELLLSHVLQCKRIDLYLKFDQTLTADQLAAFKSLFKRRLNHEPLQYITGETEFMGLRFAVDPRVLIPRPETEVLVERVIEYAKSLQHAAVGILEIGTGSGNIAVSLAKYLPDSTIVTLDTSDDALDVATGNARRHAVEKRITFLGVDIHNELSDTPVLAKQRFDLLVSNPPYISIAEHRQLQPEVRDFEPRGATTDGGDGLAFYRRIAVMGRELVKPAGVMFVEIAYNQGKSVPTVFHDAGFRSVTVLKDYSGNDRIVQVQVASN